MARCRPPLLFSIFLLSTLFSLLLFVHVHAGPADEAGITGTPPAGPFEETGIVDEFSESVSEEDRDFPAIPAEPPLDGEIAEGLPSDLGIPLDDGEEVEGVSGGIDGSVLVDGEGGDMGMEGGPEIMSDGGEDVSGVEDISGGGGGPGEGGDVLAVDVDCSAVPPFPKELFDEHLDMERVYDNPVQMKEGMFSKMAFDRYVTVFGVHIVGSKNVSDATLRQAAHVFAGVVDSDGDGKPDRAGAVESVRKYNTVIGYVADPDDSDKLWKEMYLKEENAEFREQFACNMHFFEQWASDATPDFYKAMSEKKANDCARMDEVEFDWRLWYFPFTLCYYGYLEDFDDETLDKLKTAMAHARKEELFFGNYPDDQEMEVADFFVWSLLTKLGALECHCKSDIINTVWKVCTPAALQEVDPVWFKALEEIENIPKTLPTGIYDAGGGPSSGVTPAAAGAGAADAAGGLPGDAEEGVTHSGGAAGLDGVGVGGGSVGVEDGGEAVIA